MGYRGPRHGVENKMQSGIAIILGSYLSFFALSQALAAAPLASPPGTLLVSLLKVPPMPGVLLTEADA